MDRAARHRWALLLGALGLTLVAMLWPLEEGAEPLAVSEAQPARRAMGARPSAGVPAASQVERTVPAPAEADSSDPVDPFAPRIWRAVAPPVQAPALVQEPVTAAAAAPAPPSGPPPLPYRFMGRLNDGGVDIVYLARGEQTLVARAGETLEGSYRVIAVERQAIEFEHLPSGERQRLPLPAAE